ncbi:DUF6222 family protein [Amycolatopsis mongoliensis]|uniref:DUF6222 family protein n=1 Tax=Amycolatopsis mongoliensis TaxID=715475 RepID=A0A9Y2JQX9_9PSEU|nr:DUF6222 family protein [Amycolatopsis sp. 4-36]WIY02260.1 DUF6222 family protein [Amycolatopsis sp. 4-36]
MTTSDTGRTDTGDRQPEAVHTPSAVDAVVRPMPRLGRGIVWSDIVAEIERDHLVRTRDAA